MNNQIIKDFINAYFSKTDNFFITIINNATGGTKNYYHNINSFERTLSKIIYANNKESIYFTINSFKSFDNSYLNEHKQPSKCKINVNSIKALVFDFDNPISSLNDLTNLIKTLDIKPTYILQTSPGKYQICYLLNNSNINHTHWEKINKTLAYYFDSDINVCSVEKVFRFPGFINRKNDFETKLINYDFDRKYDFSIFESFVNNTNNEKMLDCISKVSATKIETPKPKIDKIQPIININLLEDLDISLIKKYQILLKTSAYDASIADIKYIKNRRKVLNDFDSIFNEIMFIRNKINKPIKRDFDNYYNDRYNLFLED